MSAAVSPVDIAVNPNNTDQRYILWGNGRVDNVGGAPAITDHPDWTGVLYQPVAVALHISDWTTGQGYVLDLYGAVHLLNGAPDFTAQGKLSGVPYTNPTRRYVDWSWNTDGSNSGVILDHYGQLYPFGGATAPARTGPRWTWPAARKLEMQWGADMRAMTLDLYGGLHGDYNLPSAQTPGGYWPGWDAARDLVVTDWSTPGGYVLDLWGGVHTFGGTPLAFGEPYKKGADVARKLAVLSASDPTSFWQVWANGQQFEWTSSTAPTVVAGGDTGSPASTVTTTTRPTLAWSYSDAQSDSQAAWALYVFDQGFVDGHDMSDPAKWAADALVALSGTDRARRGVVADYDFANGSYRFYVRAQDTSGRWSAWDNLGWTQNIAAPDTPSGLTATVNQADYSVALSVSATTGGSADMIAFGYSDDGGATWGLVRGAEAVPLAATTTATDYDIPFGVTRTYRAVAYNDSPRVVSAVSNTITAGISARVYALTSTVNPSLGGKVQVVDAPTWTRTVKAGVFEGVGAEFPVVVDDGAPKSRRATLGLQTDLKPEWDKVAAVVEAGGVLLLRNPFGEAWYCKVVGDWGRAQVKAFPDASEDTPLRHLHKVDLPLVEVGQPSTLAVSSTVPPGPTDPNA